MAVDEERSADRLLIRHLLELHDAHDGASAVDARGKLASLRYGLRDRLHADYPCGRVIGALAAGTLTGDTERNEWRTVIAALFGYAHDEVRQEQGVSLGTALRRLYDIRGNESLERRFMA
ncbi:MAG: type I-E CRISPR-associated protein Cse2/CasB, partial [Candidatus Hadarchaeum sp.]